MNYRFVYEECDNGAWCGYVEGLGENEGACAATGKDYAECQKNLEEGLRFHLEGLRELDEC